MTVLATRRTSRRWPDFGHDAWWIVLIKVVGDLRRCWSS